MSGPPAHLPPRPTTNIPYDKGLRPGRRDAEDGSSRGGRGRGRGGREALGGRGRGRGGGPNANFGAPQGGPRLPRHVFPEDLQIPPPPRVYISPKFEEDPWANIPAVPFDPDSLIHPGCGSAPSIRAAVPQAQTDHLVQEGVPSQAFAPHAFDSNVADCNTTAPQPQQEHLDTTAKLVNEEVLGADDDDDDIL